MKNLNSRLLDAIDVRKDLDAEEKNELLYLIGNSLCVSSLIKNLS